MISKKELPVVFLLLLLLSSIMVLIVRAGVIVFGVTFYVSKGGPGPEASEFNKGDNVFLLASPPLGGKRIIVSVQLLYPPESGRPSIILQPTITITLTAETVITHWGISQNDPSGTYAMRITITDPDTGNARQEDISFVVKGDEIPVLPIVAAAAILLAVAVAAVILFRGRGPIPPPTKPPEKDEEGTQVRLPGPIAIRVQGGETITVTALLQAGQRTIPISRLPQIFGRKDFAGLVPNELLTSISRAREEGGRGHFTIGYDYAQETFVIWDENSTNGTYLNGVDIRGKGRVPLKDGDIISPANVINIRFSSSRGA